MQFETKRLILREMNPGDFDALYAILSDPETMRYYPCLLYTSIHPVVNAMMQLTDQARAYLQIMVWISAVYVIGPIMNTCWICGIFRAGGDSQFGFICDVVDMLSLIHI